MTTYTPEKAFDAIIFDCDGTLSRVEGIVELARMNGVESEVEQLTNTAMNEGKLDLAIYQHRLELAKPTRQQVERLGELYVEQLTVDVRRCINAFHMLGKPVYVISAGLLLAVCHLADELGIVKERVFAVEVNFDEQGSFIGFDHDSPMTRAAGKREIVRLLKQKHDRITLIGDGANDLATADLVERFIGFGGNYYYENIEANAQFYIYSASLLPALGLCLTAEELQVIHRSNH